MHDTDHKLWGGRFAEPTAADMAAYNDSFRFDRQLYAADIAGSRAWARALARAELIGPREAAQLDSGLQAVLAEFEAGSFQPKPGDEDIHTAVERRLGELIGEAALRLHTGRSRNDQVATDARLYAIEACAALAAGLRALQNALVGQAERHAGTLMPGYTHLQRAQPITFGHWCLAYVEMLDRDVQRFGDAARRAAVLPLGAGALSGNSLGVEREALLADMPQFTSLAQNSLDAVSDRDFAAELLFAGALAGVHLSRMAEDLVLYSSAEFGFVELADAYSTGSSLMPQKKNPDSMELLRGKSGRLLGNLVALLTVLKGLPLTYNKDMQEDKEPLFDTVATLELGLRVAAAAVATMQVNPARMASALDDAMLATDLADELVLRGVPFREAHGKVGALVRRSIALRCSLRDLPLEEFRAVQPDLDGTVRALFDPARSAARKASVGGTAPERVAEQVERWRAALDKLR
jgi:argininosuccinate lyase